MNDPLSAAAAAAAKEAVAQVGILVHRVVGPAADEVAEWLVTGVRQWRRDNLLAVASKIEQKLERVDPTWHSPPRVAAVILESASWADSDNFREYWSNLLISSMSADGESEEALLYAQLLPRLTSVQARILDLALGWQARHASDQLNKTGGDYTTAEWLEGTGAKDTEELGVSMEALVSMRLLVDFDYRWYEAHSERRTVAPSQFAARFYARVNGHNGPLKTFYRW